VTASRSARRRSASRDRYARRNFLVPILVFDGFGALNGHLLECCKAARSADNGERYRHRPDP
jgi:hypothetical protein